MSIFSRKKNWSSGILSVRFFYVGEARCARIVLHAHWDGKSNTEAEVPSLHELTFLQTRQQGWLIPSVRVS